MHTPKFHQEATKEIAAQVAHQVGNSLTSIQGFTQLLEQRLMTAADKEKELLYIKSILEEVREIQDFINFLLVEK